MESAQVDGEPERMACVSFVSLNRRGRSAVVILGNRFYMPGMTGLYNRDILRLAVSIPHQGRLEEAQASAEKRSPVCGSRVTVDVALNWEGRIARLGQDVKACALGQASASLMGAAAIGRSHGEIEAARDALAAYLDGRREDPGDWPGLTIFSEARAYKARHASILLAFEAAAEAARQASLVRLGSGQG